MSDAERRTTTGEGVLWRSALRTGGALLPAVALASYLVGGVTGLASGLGGLTLVVAGVAGWALLLRVRPDRPALLGALALGAYVAKVAVLGVAVAVLAPRGLVDGAGLAVGIVVPLFVVLTLQVRLALRTPQLWWLLEGRESG